MEATSEPKTPAASAARQGGVAALQQSIDMLESARTTSHLALRQLERLEKVLSRPHSDSERGRAQLLRGIRASLHAIRALCEDAGTAVESAQAVSIKGSHWRYQRNAMQRCVGFSLAEGGSRC